MVLFVRPGKFFDISECDEAMATFDGTSDLCNWGKSFFFGSFHVSHGMNVWYTRWWFQIFFMFTPSWGRFLFWLIFFKWVETTNYYICPHFPLNKSTKYSSTYSSPMDPIINENRVGWSTRWHVQPTSNCNTDHIRWSTWKKQYKSIKFSDWLEPTHS